MILNNTYREKKYFIVISATLLVLCFAAKGSIAKVLTSSTSLTVVNVTEFKWNSADTRQWEGHWPNDPDDLMSPEGQEIYLYNVHFAGTHMSWETTPYRLPYHVFPNAMTGMVAAVWSKDNGKTFTL